MTESNNRSGTEIPNEAELSEIAKALADELRESEEIENRRPEWVFKQFAASWRADGQAPSCLQSYSSAWSQFCQWMEQEGHQHLSDLTSAFPARHDDWIVANPDVDKKRISRSMHLSRIKNVVRYAESRRWIRSEDVPDDDIWDEVTPDLSEEEKIRSDPLEPERGEQIHHWVRENQYASRGHALWLLLFSYGLRVSAIRALDLEDLVLSMPNDWPEKRQFYPHLRLKDRPEIGDGDDPGLPLKNKREALAGRCVPLQPDHVEVFEQYVENGSPVGAKESRKEHDDPDRYGLYGLLTGEHNARLSDRIVRSLAHWLTCPTTYTGSSCSCDGCRKYRSANGRDPYPTKVGSYCQRTYSPHQIRHGAITRLLDDYSHTTVARIVGTAPDTLRKVYDRADEYRRLNRVADSWIE